MNFNLVVLVGRLTRDPELRYTRDGKAVANASIAVSEKSGDRESTSFVDLTFWERTAEILQEYCHKGSLILVEGRLKQESWENNGQKRSKLVVVVNRLQMGPKSSGDSRPGPTPARPPVAESEPTLFPREDKQDEEIPF